ncbi:glycosyltransferase family 39 protein [Noviherbaspirillum sp.]|uniref:glycosyltransferase family 39 protein n=1 Tax=Noviherbaspirillum sp. TaxID=1926288 RepID=UPI002B47B5EB|nr:glycosyltransferase family 39 protein [Noviherbaspirillum sp.]HJV82165.1 glycosyltransferase family 39 protein [Noviherbaspirillum sp.]
MTELHRPKPAVWALLLLFCAIWFLMLDVRPLTPTDEGRYAEMAREMVSTGDWITPRLNGIKYFEKPPLQTWMTALGFQAFGLGEWQARLWTGLCGLFGIFLTAYTGRRLFGPRVGFNAGLVLGSSLLWVGLGHFNTLDMGLAAMMNLSMCSLLLAQRKDANPEERRRWMFACWAGMALAVLSKGLIGVVLPGAVLVLYTLLSRDWAIWKRLHLLAGIPLFLAITAPWFILVSLKNPEFPYFFFVHEHFARFTTKVHHRTGPWHYFIPVVLLGSIPWVTMLPQSLWKARRERAPGFQPKLVLLIWSVFIFFFFSISNSKLVSYILPIFPAMALLIACHLEEASRKALTVNAGLLALLSAIGLALATRFPSLAPEAYDRPLFQAYVPWMIGAALTGLVGGLLAINWAKQKREWSIATLAVSSFLLVQLLMAGHAPLGRYKAGIEHLAAIKAELTPETPIYAVGLYEQSLPFYLRHTLTLVEHADEMDFGLQQEPQLWIPTYQGFAEKWKADARAGKKSLAIVRPDMLAKMQNDNLPIRVIAEDPRRVVVTNMPQEKPAP